LDESTFDIYLRALRFFSELEAQGHNHSQRYLELGCVVPRVAPQALAATPR